MRGPTGRTLIAQRPAERVLLLVPRLGLAQANLGGLETGLTGGRLHVGVLPAALGVLVLVVGHEATSF